MWDSCGGAASALDEAGADDGGAGRAATGGLEPGATAGRDGTGGLADDLVDGDCENALTKPAAVFDARFPTDDDTLDAMDVL